MPEPKETSNIQNLLPLLWEIGSKLQGLGYLLENQSDTGCPPTDLADYNRGIGLLVRDQGAQILNVWRSLDQLAVITKKT